MKSFICAENRSTGDGVRLLIEIESDRMGRELMEDVKAAAADFLSSDTLARDRALEATSGSFNWGDLALWLPEGYARRRGFRILDTHVTDLITDHDESLLPPGMAGGKDGADA